jgi:L-rhamnose isomerase
MPLGGVIVVWLREGEIDIEMDEIENRKLLSALDEIISQFDIFMNNNSKFRVQ